MFIAGETGAGQLGSLGSAFLMHIGSSTSSEKRPMLGRGEASELAKCPRRFPWGPRKG